MLPLTKRTSCVFLIEEFKIYLSISISIKPLLLTVTFRALGFELLLCHDDEEA